MTRLCAAVTVVVASLVLGACGSDESTQTGTPTVTKKQRSLKRAEYPAMRGWVAGSKEKASQVRLLCKDLEAGPDTPVVEVSRRACGRLLAVLIESESEEASDIDFACSQGDRSCAVRFLRDNAVRHFEMLEDLLHDYDRDIRRVMADGPCRRVLTSRRDIREVRRARKRFEAAVHAFAKGDDDALIEADLGDRRGDPKPCRPLSRA